MLFTDSFWQTLAQNKQSGGFSKWVRRKCNSQSAEESKILFDMKRTSSYSEALDVVTEKEDSLSGYESGQSSSVYTIEMTDAEKDPSYQNSVISSTVNSTSNLLAGDQSVKRESWDNKVQYLLAMIGLAVGLGNVWRFPYLAQKNGGGAFLVPYVIMLCIEGLPLFFLEVAIGQRMRKGPVGSWNEISPYLGGIGIASVVVSFVVSLYYNTIISWCIYYFFISFQSPLPWASCPTVPTRIYGNETKPVGECEMAGPTAYFWYRTTLDISSSINEGGRMLWWLELVLVAAWIIVFVCMIKGIASSGKVVYFTATFPYLVLVIFFFRGVTLPDFHKGLQHMFVPKFSRLADSQVWLDAATQIFYSLSLGFGGLIALSSYMPVRNNCYRDALLVTLTNCGTSVFAGIVIFSILGFKASKSYDKCVADLESKYSTNVTTASLNLTGIVGSASTTVGPPLCDYNKEIAKSASGPGLAFIVFTEAIIQFPFPPIWAVMFFLMLLTLGLDSMFGTLECVTTCIMDANVYPELRKKKALLPAVICLLSFLISLCFTNQAGSYTFLLFDEFTGSLPLLIIALFEVLAVSYVYGLKRFSDDIELMIGHRPNYYWLFMWKYISPLVMVIILLASLFQMWISGTRYDVWNPRTATKAKESWPGWSLFVASLLIISSIMWIPLIAIAKRLDLFTIKNVLPTCFPAGDLRREKKIQPYEVKAWEKKYLFIFEKL